MKNINKIWILLCVVVAIGCKQDKAPPPVSASKEPVVVPKFNADTAYQYVAKQVSFGPRIPGTAAADECRNWLVTKLKAYGSKVYQQKFSASFLGKKDVPAYNIIAEFNPEKRDRVLLCAHWDTRLIAEKDKDLSMQNKPILGADDGGSGVGVLLEIARLIHQNPIDLGVDLVFFDAEDNGQSGEGENTTWCLGSQHWSKTPHIKNYKADFGILLDMVGAKNAQFSREEISARFAGSLQDKIWKLAQAMGRGDRFIDQRTGGVTDDHYYVNLNLKIPTVDIINRPYPSSNGHGFGDYHHTHNDNMEIIDKSTLKSVGQVVTAVIYKKSDGSFTK